MKGRAATAALVCLSALALACEGGAGSTDTPRRAPESPSPKATCRINIQFPPNRGELPVRGEVVERKKCGAKSRWIKVRPDGGGDATWGKARKSTYRDCEVGDRWPDCKN